MHKCCTHAHVAHTHTCIYTHNRRHISQLRSVIEDYKVLPQNQKSANSRQTDTGMLFRRTDSTSIDVGQAARDSDSGNEYSVLSPMRISDDEVHTVSVRSPDRGASPAGSIDGLRNRTGILHKATRDAPHRRASPVGSIEGLRDKTGILYKATRDVPQRRSSPVGSIEGLRDRTETLYNATSYVPHRDSTPVCTTEDPRHRDEDPMVSVQGIQYASSSTAEHVTDSTERSGAEYGGHQRIEPSAMTKVRASTGEVDGALDDQQGLNTDDRRRMAKARTSGGADGVFEEPQSLNADDCGRMVKGGTPVSDAGVFFREQKSANAGDRGRMVKGRTPVSDAEVIFREQQQRLESLIRSEIEKTDDIMYLKRRLAEVCPYMYVCVCMCVCMG
jgi:hypothetical protein